MKTSNQYKEKIDQESTKNINYNHNDNNNNNNNIHHKNDHLINEKDEFNDYQHFSFSQELFPDAADAYNEPNTSLIMSSIMFTALHTIFAFSLIYALLWIYLIFSLNIWTGFKHYLISKLGFDQLFVLFVPMFHYHSDLNNNNDNNFNHLRFFFDSNHQNYNYENSYVDNGIFRYYSMPQYLVIIVLLLYTFSLLLPEEKTDRRYCRWFSRLSIWDQFSSYFPISVHMKQPLQNNQQYIAGVHPHGALGVSVMPFIMGNYFKRKCFGNIDFRLLAATALLSLPGVRDVALAVGLVDASRAVAKQFINTGHSIVIYVGGSLEAYHFCRNDDIVIIVKQRQGFIRLAIKNQVSIVPVFAFGQNDVYDQYRSFLRDTRAWLLKRLRVLLMIFWGQFLFMPYRHPVHVCVGRPIDTRQFHGDDTQENVDRIHSRYVHAVRELFEENREKYGYGDRKLIIH